jgi:hypothetical protein
MLVYLFLFFSQATGQTTGPILMLDGSFNADFAKEAPFGGDEK